jgi:hypothetical protein
MYSGMVKAKLQFVLKHMAEHADHVLHHHDDDADSDDDNSTHVDDSLKSVQHLADYDQAGSLNILFLSLICLVRHQYGLLTLLSGQITTLTTPPYPYCVHRAPA